MRARISVVVALLVGCGRGTPSGPVVDSPSTPAPTVILAPTPVPAPSLTPTPMRIGAGVTEPVELSHEMPDWKRLEHLRPGFAMFEATVSAEGIVTDVRVLRSQSRQLDALLIKAIRRWRYKPATYKGQHVSVYLTITVNLCA